MRLEAGVQGLMPEPSRIETNRQSAVSKPANKYQRYLQRGHLRRYSPYIFIKSFFKKHFFFIIIYLVMSYLCRSVWSTARWYWCPLQYTCKSRRRRVGMNYIRKRRYLCWNKIDYLTFFLDAKVGCGIVLWRRRPVLYYIYALYIRCVLSEVTINRYFEDRHRCYRHFQARHRWISTFPSSTSMNIDIFKLDIDEYRYFPRIPSPTAYLQSLVKLPTLVF